MPVTYRNIHNGEERQFDEPDRDTARDRDWVLATDNRTVLYALPEDQPDSLSEGHESHQADLDKTPAEKAEADEESAAADDAPAKSANKAAWVDYAETQGADRDTAESMTKDDLIAAYGG